MRAQLFVPLGGAVEIVEPVARQCLGPRNSWRRRREGHGGEERRARRRIAGDRRDPERQPVGEIGEERPCLAIDRGGRIELVEPVVCPRQQHEALGLLVAVAVGAARDRRNGIDDSLRIPKLGEVRLGQESPSQAVELRVEPGLVLQQPPHRGPAFPRSRGARGKNHGIGRPGARVGEERCEELGCAPRLARDEGGIGSGERRLRGESRDDGGEQEYGEASAFGKPS